MTPLFACVFLMVAGKFVASAPTASPDDCQNITRSDVYMLLDGSSSLNNIGFGRELNFTINVMSAVPYGPQNTQFGFGQFSTTFKHIFNLTTYPNREDAQQVVRTTTQLKGITNTHVALRRIRETGYLTNPLFGSRLLAKKFLVIITDGQSDNGTQTVLECQLIRQLNITIIVIAVGVVNLTECQLMAGNNASVISVKSFGVIDTIKDQLTERICQATTTVQTTVKPTTPEPTTPEPTTPEPTTSEPTTTEPTTSEPTTPEPTTPEPTTREPTTLEPTTSEPTTPEPTTPEPTTPKPTTPEPTTPQPTTPQPTTPQPTTPETTTPEPTTPEPTTPVRTTPEPTTSEPTTAESTTPKPTTTERTTPDLETPQPTTSMPTTAEPTTSQPATGEPSTPKPTNIGNTTVTPLPCIPSFNNSIKVMFVFDFAGSIGEAKFRVSFQFLVDLVRRFYCSAKFGLITYGDFPRLFVSLTANKDLFLNPILNGLQAEDGPLNQGSTSNLDLALGVADPVIDADRNSPGPAVIIVITNRPFNNPPKTLQTAQAIKNKNINFVVVGVGNQTDQTDLNALASRPEFYLGVNAYINLRDIIDKIIFILCCRPTPEPQTPEPTTQEPTTREPTTPEPTTAETTTAEPTTPKSTSSEPTTPEPASYEPITPKPTTQEPRTPEPIISEPTTPEPNTPEPTTLKQQYTRPKYPTTTTPQQTTPKPTTAKPTTPERTTPVPTTTKRTTAEPTTAIPTTAKSTTSEPTTPKPTTIGNTTVTPLPCIPSFNNSIKVMFVFDFAGSIGEAKFRVSFQFLVDLVQRFYCSAKFGLITYGNFPRLFVSLTANKDLFLRPILNGLQAEDGPLNQGSTSDLDLALGVADPVINADRNSPGPAVIFVITNRPFNNPPKTLQTAQAIKNKGINFVVVGVGNQIDPTSLSALATRPEWFLTVNAYINLQDIIANILFILCCR